MLPWKWGIGWHKTLGNGTIHNKWKKGRKILKMTCFLLVGANNQLYIPSVHIWLFWWWLELENQRLFTLQYKRGDRVSTHRMS